MKKTFLFITSVMLLHVVVSAVGASEISPDKKSILVIPFRGDASCYAEAIGAESAWVLGRKLKLRDIEVITWQSFLSRHEKDGLAEDTDSYDFGSYKTLAEKDRIAWIAGGEVKNVGVDKANIEGPWLLGLCAIPIHADISADLYEISGDTPVLHVSGEANKIVPRVRILGFYKNPIPYTPRSIDAFIHDTLIRLADDMAIFIHQKSGKENR